MRVSTTSLGVTLGSFLALFMGCSQGATLQGSLSTSGISNLALPNSSPTPTASANPTPVSTPTPTPNPTPGPSSTPSPVVTPKPTPSPTPTPVGSHGNVRGRVKIANGTVVADDGSILRFSSGYVHDFVYQYYTSLTWWQQQHNIGHFNGVRVMAFLGSWPSSSQTMDVPTLLARLDIMVSLAAQTGMYVLIDNHSECCGSQDLTNDTAFWKAVAPRYANNTNVIYELKNEPWQYSGLPAYETAIYNVIRPLAPSTHIICWTIENMIDLTDPVSLIKQSPGIDYSNASFGWHPYGTYGNTTKVLANVAAVKNAGYPVVLTEIAPDVAGAPGFSFAATTLNNMGISWFYLNGQGFETNGTIYGWNNDGISIGITWPSD